MRLPVDPTCKWAKFTLNCIRCMNLKSHSYAMDNNITERFVINIIKQNNRSKMKSQYCCTMGSKAKALKYSECHKTWLPEGASEKRSQH